MSPGARRRLDRSRSAGDRCAGVGRARGLSFKTSVERLEPRCMLSGQGLAQTAFTTVMLANPSGASPATTGSSSPPSAAYTPTEILNAYGFSQVTFSNGTIQGNGAGQTIALIDANNDPDITADLATFDTAFNLPAPPSFVIEGQTGTSQLPSTPAVGSDADWSLEISLDVEWAHALAPTRASCSSKRTAATFPTCSPRAATAANTPGVVVVSMSFGASNRRSRRRRSIRPIRLHDALGPSRRLRDDRRNGDSRRRDVRLLRRRHRLAGRLSGLFAECSCPSAARR